MCFAPTELTYQHQDTMQTAAQPCKLVWAITLLEVYGPKVYGKYPYCRLIHPCKDGAVFAVHLSLNNNFKLVLFPDSHRYIKQLL